LRHFFAALHLCASIRVLPFCAMSVVLGICAVGGSPAKRANERAARGGEIVRLVRENFYDKKSAAAWADRHMGYGATVTTDRAFEELTRRALSELKASHTGYYPIGSPDWNSLVAIYGGSLHAGDGEYEGIGADITPDRFVRVVFAGGPAAQAGIERGDRILKADDKPFDPARAFRGKTGVPVTLSVQHVAYSAPRTIKVTPRRIKPKVEWMQALQLGARLIESHGRKIAYVPMFSCAGEEYEKALKELLTGRFREAPALILDFRNGWGGCNPEFVNLFGGAAPALSYKRPGECELHVDVAWQKPVYVLINRGTRSGKEVVAYGLKKQHLAVLVGQPTAGAVVAGRAFLLKDRSLLLLAVANVWVDGERLEGKGVQPDIAVADALQFAHGADLQLSTAVEVAAKGREEH
jgi:carboxyl-terminal processing protease